MNMNFVLPKKVDLAVFAGQSNMSGRGDASQAVKCHENAGFEYKSVSKPGILAPVREPFGLGEDRPGLLDDVHGLKTSMRAGSMVSAVIDEYHKLTGRQIAAVSASKGGTSTVEWKSIYISDALKRLDDTKKFLTDSGIGIERAFVVWCQGETDGDIKMTAEAYTKNTLELFDAFAAHGAEKFFVVQIGHYNYIQYPKNGLDIDAHYKIIRDAQAELCAENDNCILAGSFEGYITDMSDVFHYNQTAYNSVGKTVGNSIAHYYG